jgi:poly-gamma-glutamate capsule biosynthesis protein CapA/YwtB (metallophosphatase superfamily)
MRSRKPSKTTKSNKLRRKWLRRSLGMLIAALIAGGAIIWSNTNNKLEPAAENTGTPALSSTSPLATPNTQSTVTPNSTQSLEPTTDHDNAANVHLAFVGDILLASGVETIMQKSGYDFPYREVKGYLQQPDLTIGNLETPVTTRGTILKKEYNYRSSPLALPALAAAGFDVVNLANNHVMDYGTEGLLDTIDYLNKAGIQHVGAGHDRDEAFKPLFVDKKGIKIAVLGFSRIVPDNSWKAGANHPGVADTYDYSPPVKAIQLAKSQADLVVVITHWGIERKDTPEAYETDLAHRFIDAGADLIVGGHPHVLQGFETYKGKWIAYSLGNFIFTTNTVKDTLETMILNASCSKDGKCTISAVPIYTSYAKPIQMNEEQGLKLFERISALSVHSRINPDGAIVELP